MALAAGAKGLKSLLGSGAKSARKAAPMGLAPGGVRGLGQVLRESKSAIRPIKSGSRIVAANDSAGRYIASDIVPRGQSVLSSARRYPGGPVSPLAGARPGTNYLAMGFSGKNIKSTPRASAPTRYTSRKIPVTGRSSQPVTMGPTRGRPISVPSGNNLPVPYRGGVPATIPRGGVPATIPKASVPARVNLPAPPNSPGLAARHGKLAAAAVVGAVGVGAMNSRTGKGVDKQTGLPRGMYNY